MGSIKDGLNVSNAQETLELSDFAWERFNMGHSSLELGEMAKADAALKLWTGKTSDINKLGWTLKICLLYTSPSPRDRQRSRMPSSA